MKKDISVIISTYNSPEWLEKVLYGFNTQTYRNFEVVIADDGSDNTTKQCLIDIQKEVFFPIIMILNIASLTFFWLLLCRLFLLITFLALSNKIISIY